MIKIEFEAATGADLRKEMLDLLGLNGADGISKSAFVELKTGDGVSKFKDLQPVEAEAKKVEMEIDTTEETPKPEPTTRKRRSRAEIEAEAALAANTGKEEPPASTDKVETEVSDMSETLAQDNAEQNAITYNAEKLIKMAVGIGRIIGAPGRDKNLAMLEKDFGGATISKKDGKPQLTVEQYPAVVEGFHRVVNEFLPSLSTEQKEDLIRSGFNLPV